MYKIKIHELQHIIELNKNEQDNYFYIFHPEYFSCEKKFKCLMLFIQLFLTWIMFPKLKFFLYICILCFMWCAIDYVVF